MAASFDFALANHALHQVLFHEAGFGEADAFARVRVVMAELVEAGRASGEIEVADPDLATEFLLHGPPRRLVAAIHHPRTHRRREVAGVTELICQALGVRTPGGAHSGPVGDVGRHRCRASATGPGPGAGLEREGRTPAQ